MLVEAARFEPRSDAKRNAGPARNAIERVPAMIEQDAAASHRRIDTPVRDTVRAYGDRRLRSQRPPADGSHRADRVPVNQRRNLAADRGFEPVVHRVQDASSAPRRPCYALRVLDLSDQRLFAE